MGILWQTCWMWGDYKSKNRNVTTLKVNEQLTKSSQNQEWTPNNSKNKIIELLIFWIFELKKHEQSNKRTKIIIIIIIITEIKEILPPQRSVNNWQNVHRISFIYKSGHPLTPKFNNWIIDFMKYFFSSNQ